MNFIFICSWSIRQCGLIFSNNWHPKSIYSYCIIPLFEFDAFEQICALLPKLTERITSDDLIIFIELFSIKTNRKWINCEKIMR